MSDLDLEVIVGASGRFRGPQYSPGDSRPTGKSRPEPGNAVPAPAVAEPDAEALAARLNVASQSIGRDLRFEVDMNTGRSVILVLDRETGEVIREIPPEKAKISVAASGDMELRLYDRMV